MPYTPLPTLPAVKRVLILGSTGSIGEQALDVISRSDELEVAGLSAATGWERLLEQAATVDVGLVALADPEAARAARGSGWKGEVLTGEEGMLELIGRSEADIVLNAIVGSAGLGPTIAALSGGIELALANKESLVVGGELVMALSEAAEARILPVDSEHSALHQLIRGEPAGSVDRLVLTASGGPFRGRVDLTGISREEALAHPTWDMGGKISIDSATLMNKGLELIEAHHLFGLGYDEIDVVVHPQSLIHSLIHLADGSTLAHLGHPDMRVPIAYALFGPERLELPVEHLDLAEDRLLDVRGARHRDLRLPAPGARSGGDGRDRSLHPQRRQRGRRRRLPRRRAALHRHRRGRRAGARSGPGSDADPLPGPLRLRRRGPRPRGRGGRRRRRTHSIRKRERRRMSWFFAIAGFCALVVLHEAGHFTAAKVVGMRVEKFFLFFPPKVASITRGETEYGIGAIPLGGYVKISGMNPEEELPPEVEERAYHRMPVWKRIFVIAAGPAVNIVLALVMFWFLAVGFGLDGDITEQGRARR